MDRGEGGGRRVGKTWEIERVVAKPQRERERDTERERERDTERLRSREGDTERD